MKADRINLRIPAIGVTPRAARPPEWRLSQAARGGLSQAGYRLNPELTIEVENFAGSGPYRGTGSTETTVSLKRLDLGGRRSTRISNAQARLAVQDCELRSPRADLAQSVRVRFATAIAAQECTQLRRSLAPGARYY
jgi:cobalt-zinc-cadmium efflux system outer membrane protein